MAREAQALTVATRYAKPANFGGSPTAWRALCEVYPSAETPDVIMAVVEYCAVRKLDPYKRPVSVVPMYNSRLRRKVQVVMQGINEIEITASRTGKWAGMDAAKWGPTIEQTFRGSFERDDGTAVATETTVKYPEWCEITVYRARGDQRDPFTERLYWLESYARAGFRSEVPNARWQQAPRQMLHKCTKAAVLRATFPEEGLDYSAEEMEDRETDAGGFIIDGVAERPSEPAARTTSNGAAAVSGPGASPPPAGTQDGVTAPPPPADREQQRETQSRSYAPPTIAEQLEAEPDPGKWMKLVEKLADAAPDSATLMEVATHRGVRHALDHAPSLIAANLREILRRNHERLATAEEPPPDDESAGGPLDPLTELLAEVATMDLPALNALPSNTNWQALTRDLFPSDFERLDAAIADRKRTLTTASDANSTSQATDAAS